MDDIKLRSFIAVVDSGSINKAAEQLDIAPVSVKRQLDAIEAEVGGVLLQRTPQGTALTQSGKYYYDFAKETLEQFAHLKKKIARHAPHSKKILTVCSSSSYSSVDLEALAVAFMKRHPDIAVLLLPSDTITWVDNVLTGKADCATCNQGYFDSLETDKLLYHPTLKTHYVAIMSPTHPLAAQKQLTMAQLSGEKLYFNHRVLNTFYALTQEHGIQTEHIHLSPSSSMVFNICTAGSIYITVAPFHAQFSSLVSAEVDAPALGCGFITGKHMPAALEAFIQFAQQPSSSNTAR